MGSDHNSQKNKFFFDLHDFEKEAEEEKEKRSNKSPPAPSFSLEDMEEARRVAHEKGKEEGLQLAKDSIEQTTELIVQSLEDSVHALTKAEAQRHQDYLAHTVAITFKTVKKILPSLLDESKEDIIVAALTGFFAESTMKGDISLQVHPSMTEAVEKHIQKLGNTIVIEGNDQLNPAQAKVEWKNGLYEFTPDKLMEQILQTIKCRLPETDPILDDPQKKPHNKETDHIEQDS
jgi:flagellar biosynthesis/type III secretory pathway protein FliH